MRALIDIWLRLDTQIRPHKALGKPAPIPEVNQREHNDGAQPLGAEHNQVGSRRSELSLSGPSDAKLAQD